MWLVSQRGTRTSSGIETPIYALCQDGCCFIRNFANVIIDHHQTKSIITVVFSKLVYVGRTRTGTGKGHINANTMDRLG